jgi:hypothetical protein
MYIEMRIRYVYCLSRKYFFSNLKNTLHTVYDSSQLAYSCLEKILFELTNFKMTFRKRNS